MGHFISKRAKTHAISVTPPLLITKTQEGFTVKIIYTVILQRSLVGSHNTNLGAVAQGALELYVFQFGRCYFLSDSCVFGYIF